MNTRIIRIALLMLILSGAAFGVSASKDDADLYLWPLLTVDKDAGGAEVNVLPPIGNTTADRRETFRHPSADYLQASRGRRIFVGHPLALVNISRDSEGANGRIFPLKWEIMNDGTYSYNVPMDFPLPLLNLTKTLILPMDGYSLFLECGK